MQNYSKVDIRKNDICSKSLYGSKCLVKKTLYGSKFLVSEYIFKLIFIIVNVAGDQSARDIACARDVAKRSLNRLLLLLVLKSCYPRCAMEKLFFKTSQISQESTCVEVF